MRAQKKNELKISVFLPSEASSCVPELPTWATLGNSNVRRIFLVLLSGVRRLILIGFLVSWAPRILRIPARKFGHFSQVNEIFMPLALKPWKSVENDASQHEFTGRLEWAAPYSNCPLIWNKICISIHHTGRIKRKKFGQKQKTVPKWLEQCGSVGFDFQKKLPTANHEPLLEFFNDRLRRRISWNLKSKFFG